MNTRDHNTLRALAQHQPVTSHQLARIMNRHEWFIRRALHRLQAQGFAAPDGRASMRGDAMWQAVESQADNDRRNRLYRMLHES
jgi:predicted ArsR family transcriptional regulator